MMRAREATVLGGVNVFGGASSLALILLTEAYRVAFLNGIMGNTPNSLIFGMGGFAGYALLMVSGFGLLKQQAWGRTSAIAAALLLLALPMLGIAFTLVRIVGVQMNNPSGISIDETARQAATALFGASGLIGYSLLLLGAMFFRPFNQAPYRAVPGAVLEQDVPWTVAEEGNTPSRIYQWLGGIHALAAFFALGSIGSVFSAGLPGQTGLGSSQPMMMLPALLMAVPTAFQIATAVGLLTGKRWTSIVGCIYAVLFLLLGSMQSFAVYVIQFSNTSMPDGLHGYLALNSLRSTVSLALLPIATYALLRRYTPAHDA